MRESRLLKYGVEVDDVPSFRSNITFQYFFTFAREVADLKAARLPHAFTPAYAGGRKCCSSLASVIRSDRIMKPSSRHLSLTIRGASRACLLIAAITIL